MRRIVTGLYSVLLIGTLASCGDDDAIIGDDSGTAGAGATAGVGTGTETETPNPPVDGADISTGATTGRAFAGMGGAGSDDVGTVTIRGGTTGSDTAR